MIEVEGIYLPHKPLTNIELTDAVKRLKIPNFRGVYMRDQLPNKPNRNECGILNFDDSKGDGTHWVAWYKKSRNKYYFDSFGVQPPLELRDYLKSPIYYSTEQIQKRNQVICGHLCLHMLKRLSNGEQPQNIINDIYRDD